MFQKGDLIIYSNEGVCRVEDVAPLKTLSDSTSDKFFYKLSPIYGKGSILIPVDTKVFMRPIISKEEAHRLISKIPEVKCMPVEIKNQKKLHEYYESSFTSHKCEDLIKLIKTVNVKTKKQISNGKKPGQTEQRYLKRAEDLLLGEFAIVLDLPCNEVIGYIEKELEELEKKVV